MASSRTGILNNYDLDSYRIILPLDNRPWPCKKSEALNLSMYVCMYVCMYVTKHEYHLG